MGPWSRRASASALRGRDDHENCVSISPSTTDSGTDGGRDGGDATLPGFDGGMDGGQDAGDAGDASDAAADASIADAGSDAATCMRTGTEICGNMEDEDCDGELNNGCVCYTCEAPIVSTAIVYRWGEVSKPPVGKCLIHLNKMDCITSAR